jgi:hypothetical protein
MNALIHWASAHPVQAMGYTIATLTYLQTVLRNWQLELGWQWAGRVALFLGSFPLSGSMGGMAKAFKRGPIAEPAASVTVKAAINEAFATAGAVPPEVKS